MVVIQSKVLREKSAYGLSPKNWLTTSLVLSTGSMNKKWTRHQSVLSPLGCVLGHSSFY